MGRQECAKGEGVSPVLGHMDLSLLTIYHRSSLTGVITLGQAGRLHLSLDIGAGSSDVILKVSCMVDYRVQVIMSQWYWMYVR